MVINTYIGILVKIPPPYVDQDIDDAQPSSKESNQTYHNTVINPVPTCE